MGMKQRLARQKPPVNWTTRERPTGYQSRGQARTSNPPRWRMTK